MADLLCALVDATGTISNVVVCCGGTPATCSLKPTRITAAMGAVGPGYTSDGQGGFVGPPPPVPPLASVGVSVGTTPFAGASVTK